MRILEIEQGSTSWLEMRMGKITGTDAGILTGSSPFKTKLDLWKQKLGILPPDEVNDKMRRGSELEQPARWLLSENLGIEFKPAVAISDIYEWMLASVDGLSPCLRFMCEIKCPSKIQTHKDAINKCYHSYYHDQMQHCLAVTGCEKCYFCSYFPGYEKEIAIIEVYPDLEKQAEIISKGQEFYINMCTMNPPNEWQLELRK